MSFANALKALMHDDAGGTVVEYALAMALLSGAAIGALAMLGATATTALVTDGDALTGVGRTTPGGP